MANISNAFSDKSVRQRLGWEIEYIRNDIAKVLISGGPNQIEERGLAEQTKLLPLVSQALKELYPKASAEIDLKCREFTVQLHPKLDKLINEAKAHQQARPGELDHEQVIEEAHYNWDNTDEGG